MELQRFFQGRKPVYQRLEPVLCLRDVPAPAEYKEVQAHAKGVGEDDQQIHGASALSALDLPQMIQADVQCLRQLHLRHAVFFTERLEPLSAFIGVVIHKKSFPEQGGAGLPMRYKAIGQTKKAPYKSEWMGSSHNHSNLVRRLAVSSGTQPDSLRLLDSKSYRLSIQLSALARPPAGVGAGASVPDAPEVPQVYGVFLLAFLAEYHLVACDVRENTLHKIAAVGAVDVTQAKPLRF